MSNDPHLSTAIGPLEIDIERREQREIDNQLDDDWVIARVQCKDSGACVVVNGFVHLKDLHAWLDRLVTMHHSLKGEANFICMEPNFRIAMSINAQGQINSIIHITPDHQKQKHEFNFNWDQSYLPSLIAGLRSILAIYPINGSNQTKP